MDATDISDYINNKRGHGIENILTDYVYYIDDMCFKRIYSNMFDNFDICKSDVDKTKYKCLNKSRK